MIDSNGYMFDINYKCDGSRSDCNKAIKEILRLEKRWEALRNELETFINKVKSLPISEDNKSIGISSFEAILGAMAELEEK